MKIKAQCIITVGKSGEVQDVFAGEFSGCEVTLSEVFNGVGIRTVEGKLFGIAQRDNGLEIKCPHGELIGLKYDQAGLVIERNCERVG